MMLTLCVIATVFIPYAVGRLILLISYWPHFTWLRVFFTNAAAMEFWATGIVLSMLLIAVGRLLYMWIDWIINGKPITSTTEND